MNLQRLWYLLVIIAFSMPVFAVAPYQIDSFDDINDVVGGGADPNWVETPTGEDPYGSYVEQELVAEVTEGAGSMKFDFPSYVPGYKSDEVKRGFSPALDWSSNWEELAITLWVWSDDPYETRRTTVKSPGGIKLNRLKEITLIDGSGRSGHFPIGPLLVLKDTGWNKVIAPLRNFACKDTGGVTPIDPDVFDWNDINDIVLYARTEHTSDHNAIYIDDMQLELAPDPCSRPYQLASCDDVNDDLWDELRLGSNMIMFQSDSNTEGTGSMMLDYDHYVTDETVATPSLAFIPALDFTDGNDWAFTIWVWTDLVGESHLYHMVLHDVGDHLGRYRVPTLVTYGWNKITARMDEFLWQDALEVEDLPTHTSDEVNLDAILFMEMWTRNLPVPPPDPEPRRGNPIYLDDFRIEPAVEALSEAVVYNADYASVPLAIDGSASDWAGLVDSDIIDFDLQAVPEPNGDLHVKYRLAWDYDYLYILVEEQTGDTETAEAADDTAFRTDEMVSLYDGLSLWFDFTNNRLPEVEMHISFWLHLGLSSTGRTDLYSAWTNAGWDPDAHDPAAVTNISVATSGTRPSRVIEARVKWSDLDSTLDSWWQPVGGIEAAVQAGYIFGCDPRLQDRENLEERIWTDEHCMAWLTGWAWDDFRLGDFLPTGRDTNSIDIRLVCSAGDLDFDCDVDFVDYSQFAIQYTETDCNSLNDFCNGADLLTPMNGEVDLKDLGRFALRWLLP